MDLIKYIMGSSPKSFWELLRESDLNATSLVDELNRLYKSTLITVRDGKIYTEKNVVKRDTRCRCCDNGFLIDQLGDIYYRFRHYYDKRPINISRFDQGSMACRDVFKRVAFIYDKGDLYQMKILILGDDDLLSIAIALTGLPSKIMVLDIDKRIIDYISAVSKKENLGIEARVYSVEDELRLQKEIDIFITDPVESLSGIKLFLSRGISCLVNYGRFYFGFTHIDSSLSKWQKIESMLLSKGCVITDIVRDFASYPGVYSDAITERLFFDPGAPPRDWYTSTLIRGVKLEDRISDPGSVSLGESLYKDEETVTVKEGI